MLSRDLHGATAHLELVDRNVRGSDYYANFTEQPERGEACPIAAGVDV
jgi:hypothetical protein